jgi:hypothetical protein
LGDAPGTPADRAGGDPGEDSIGAIKLLAAQAPEPHPGNEVAILHNRFIDLARQIAGQWDRLADSDRQRREFIANISHDLRTPLTSLLGYLETLTLKADRLSAEESKRYLNIALRQGNKVRLFRSSCLSWRAWSMAASSCSRRNLCWRSWFRTWRRSSTWRLPPAISAYSSRWPGDCRRWWRIYR